MFLCHYWPGISPWNVWDLPFGMWCQFAAFTDAYIAEQKKEAAG